MSGRSPGDTPASPSNDSARRHILRFEVAAETLAIFRQASAELRRCSGSTLDDDALLMEMARRVFGRPQNEARATYQIALTVCDRCGAGQQDAGPDAVAVGAHIVEMARCDAQHLGRVDMEPANDASTVHVGRPPGSARASVDAHEIYIAHPQQDLRHDAKAHPMRDDPSQRDRPSTMDAAQRDIPHAAQTHHLRNLQANGDRPSKLASKPHVGRAKQNVPPAVRRAVLRRDRGRCRVPGCGNSVFLDVHHLALRSEGGSHRADNLITVCGAHHRALHRGELSVERDRDTGLRFKHADGSLYGDDTDPQLLDTINKLFAALRRLGFRESEVRAALEELRASGRLRNSSLQNCLRTALASLTSPADSRP